MPSSKSFIYNRLEAVLKKFALLQLCVADAVTDFASAKGCPTDPVKTARDQDDSLFHGRSLVKQTSELPALPENT